MFKTMNSGLGLIGGNQISAYAMPTLQSNAERQAQEIKYIKERIEDYKNLSNILWEGAQLLRHEYKENQHQYDMSMNGHLLSVWKDLQVKIVEMGQQLASIGELDIPASETTHPAGLK